MAAVNLKMSAKIKEKWWAYPLAALASIVGVLPFCKPLAKRICMLCIDFQVENG